MAFLLQHSGLWSKHSPVLHSLQFLWRNEKDAIKLFSFLCCLGECPFFFSSTATIPSRSSNQLLVFVLIAWLCLLLGLSYRRTEFSGENHTTTEHLARFFKRCPPVSAGTVCVFQDFPLENRLNLSFSFEKDLKTACHMWGWPLSVVAAHRVPNVLIRVTEAGGVKAWPATVEEALAPAAFEAFFHPFLILIFLHTSSGWICGGDSL